MDRDTSEEFKRIWKSLEQSQKDGRELTRVSTSLQFLAKKVDRFSYAVTALAITVVADLINAHIK